MSVESHTFDSGNNGPRVLIFGAIHGDEECGPVALRALTKELQSGTRTLVQGSVTLVPVCNQQAYDEHSRVHRENLNRVFKKTEHPATYEERLANELCALVDEHDVLLDIHSSAVPAPSNVFVDYPTEDNLAFAKALNPEFLIYDWPKVYENNPFAFPAWTTDRYAHEAGKIGVLVECGKHDDLDAPKRAKDATLRTLAHFGLIAPLPETTTREPRAVYMERIFEREHADDRFLASWSHLQEVPKGTAIAKRATGTRIVVDKDSFIIFPKDYALPGGEWFYLGAERA